MVAAVPAAFRDLKRGCQPRTASIRKTVAEIASRVFESSILIDAAAQNGVLQGIYRLWEGSVVPAATRRKPGFALNVSGGDETEPAD
jgi:hypothetical protein